MISIFGYETKLPSDSWSEIPATENQMSAIEQTFAWREIAPGAQMAIIHQIVNKAGIYPGGNVISKRVASIVIDFYANALPEQKKRAEKAAFDKLSGQGEMFA